MPLLVFMYSVKSSVAQEERMATSPNAPITTRGSFGIKRILRPRYYYPRNGTDDLSWCLA